jgi:hypothetical protein
MTSVSEDVARHIDTRLDRHRQRALDDALRLAVCAVALSRDVPVLGDLIHVLRQLGQLAAQQVAVNHGEAGIEDAVLEDAKVQELPQRQRLEAVTQERVLLTDHTPGLQNAGDQSCRRAVQDDEVDGIGTEVPRHGADRGETGFYRVGAGVEIHGQVDVTDRTQLVTGCPTEEVGEADPELPRKDRTEGGQPVLDVSGKRWSASHDPMGRGLQSARAGRRFPGRRPGLAGALALASRCLAHVEQIIPGEEDMARQFGGNKAQARDRTRVCYRPPCGR